MAHIAFICQPHDRLALTRRSSVAIVTANLARGIAEAGHRVSILAPDADIALSDPALAGTMLVHVPTPWLKAGRIREFVSGQLSSQPPFMFSDRYFAGYFHAVLRNLQALKPDIVHVPTHAQYLPAISQAVPAARIVLHLHDELLSHLPTNFVRPLLEHASLVVCVNSHIRARLAERMPEIQSRVSVLHNGVDPALFHRSAASGRRERRVVYAGRLSPEKGLHVLGAAVKRVHAHFPNLRVDVIGSPGLIPYEWLQVVAKHDVPCAELRHFYGTGPFGRAFRALTGGARYVRECVALAGPAGPSFTVHGFVPQSELGRYFASAIAVVCPSACNEIAMSAYEGMATGLPAVISYDFERDGPIAQRETALVVPRADPASFADALMELLANPSLADTLGEAAQRNVLDNFAWRNGSERLLHLYARVLGG